MSQIYFNFSLFIFFRYFHYGPPIHFSGAVEPVQLDCPSFPSFRSITLSTLDLCPALFPQSKALQIHASRKHRRQVPGLLLPVLLANLAMFIDPLCQFLLQITVRIRTLRSLLYLSALTTLRNFLTMSLLLFIILYLAPNCLFFVTLFCGHAFDLTVALYSLLLIVSVIFSHKEFQKHFK